jgi:hypothetical protein
MDALQQIGLVDENKQRRFAFVEGTSVGSLGCLGFAVQGMIPAMLSPQPAGSGRFGDIYICRASTRSGDESITAAIEFFTQNFVPRVRHGTVFRCGEASVTGASAIESTQNSSQPAPRATGFRERELEWRRTHTRELRALQNQWVVLEGEQIIAHGENPADLIREARSKGVRTPYIFFVEPNDDNIASFGL